MSATATKPSRSSRSRTPLDMDERAVNAAATTLKLIADPTRLRVLAILSHGEKNVGELCAALEQGQPAVSHHLALMRVSGIVVGRRSGKHIYYSLSDAGWKAIEGCR